MRPLAFLAAITIMHTVHAIPRPDLTVRQDGNDLRNQSHIFHHLDRNQWTANRDRERERKNDAERSGLPFIKRVSERPQRARVARERVVERRFMRNPDYSEDDDGSDDSNSTSSESAASASDTMTTQQPSATATNEPTSMGDA